MAGTAPVPRLCSEGEFLCLIPMAFLTQSLMVLFSSDSSFTLGTGKRQKFHGMRCEIRAIRTKYSLLYQTYALTGRVSIYESMSWYILFPTSFNPFCPDWVAERCFLSWTLYSSTATGRAIKYRKQSGFIIHGKAHCAGALKPEQDRKGLCSKLSNSCVLYKLYNGHVNNPTWFLFILPLLSRASSNTR